MVCYGISGVVNCGTHFSSTEEVKSVGTFPVITVKLVTPSLPPQTKLNFEQNGGGGGISVFWGHNIAEAGGEWGSGGMRGRT